MDKKSNEIEMKKEVCFILNGQTLYLDQLLVDFNNIPIFFVCKGDGNYYFVLCSDIHSLSYYVVLTSVEEIFKVLKQQIDMRDVFLSKDAYWHIISGDTVDNDLIEKRSVLDMDKSVLPCEGAKYES